MMAVTKNLKTRVGMFKNTGGNFLGGTVFLIPFKTFQKYFFSRPRKFSMGNKRNPIIKLRR